MTKAERNQSILKVIDLIGTLELDLIGYANDLEDLWLNDHAERIRSVVGELENIDHALLDLASPYRK